MATRQPVWTRAYLKSIGANDNEIDYQNGAVTYKGKPFQYTLPSADGKAYGSQAELDGAKFRYHANDALDQYKQNISKPVQPFTYDMNSIKNDPLYTSGLASLQQDAERATNQSLVNLGRRGIGNSQSAVTSANAQQQNVVNQANTKLAPQVIAQKYQQYLDANAQQDKQNQNLLGFANTQNSLGQQTFNNTLAQNQDTRAGQAQEFGQGVTRAGLTGYLDETTPVKQQMAANSSAWATATPEEQQRLHDENLRLAASIGATYDPNTGEYTFKPGTRTMAGQAQDFNQNMTTEQFKYGQEQDAIRNTAQYAGYYQGQPTMQRIMQEANLRNMTADNARAAASEARSAGNQRLGALFDIWDRTGSAPAGIPGVAPGTPIAGKTKAPETAETYSKYVDSVAIYNSDKELTNPDAVESAILNSGLDDYEMFKLYKAKGLKWDGPTPEKK